MSCPYQRKYEPIADDNDDEIVKEIPSSWFDFGIINLIKFSRRGQMFFKERKDYHGSSVYKINFHDENRIMLCDHVAVRSVFDINKVSKEPSFGFVQYNTRLTDPYIPSIFQNGETHVKLKTFLLDFMEKLHKDLTIAKIIEVVKLEFEKMESVEFANVTDAEGYDFEIIFKKAVGNVLMYIMLGEYPEDPMLMFEWLDNVIGLELQLWFKSSSKVLAGKVYQMVKQTEKMKQLKNEIDSLGIEHDERIYNLLFTMIFNATGGMAVIVLSSIASFLRLSTEDQQLLKDDASKLFSSSQYDEVFPTLSTVHSFYLEVMRMYPPVPSVYGRAIKDFNLKSTSGTYAIQKGDLLCASVVLTHRDKNVFSDPDTFILNRPIDDLEKYNIGYGGFFRDTSTPYTHKCAGNELSNNIAKVFIAFLMRCSIIPTKVPVHTFTKAQRLEASDEPIKVMKFKYQN